MTEGCQGDGSSDNKKCKTKTKGENVELRSSIPEIPVVWVCLKRYSRIHRCALY